MFFFFNSETSFTFNYIEDVFIFEYSVMVFAV